MEIFRRLKQNYPNKFILASIMGQYDDEWEELNDRTKDTYYCIPLPKSKTFLKIPKNREWGTIIGTPFMRMLEYANGREDPFENYIETSIEPNFLPPAIFRPDAGGGFTSDVIGFSQMNDLSKNEDFAGRTIVPYSYQQGTPGQQYDSETSWVAKKLGQLFNWSPMQIDYIISDYCGDFGDLFILATAKSSWAGEGNAAEKLLKMVRNPFIADARYSNYDVNSYYELTEELGKVVQDKKNQLGNEKYKETIEYQTQKALDIMYGDQISELNRYVRDLPDDDEKDAVKAQIAQLAGDATEFYEDSMAGKVSNPIRTAEYHDFSETVSKELIRMDAFSGDYKFTPTGNPSSKYTDPNDKNREYILTDEQKALVMAPALEGYYGYNRYEDYDADIDLKEEYGDAQQNGISLYLRGKVGNKRFNNEYVIIKEMKETRETLIYLLGREMLTSNFYEVANEGLGDSPEAVLNAFKEDAADPEFTETFSYLKGTVRLTGLTVGGEAIDNTFLLSDEDYVRFAELLLNAQAITQSTKESEFTLTKDSYFLYLYNDRDGKYSNISLTLRGVFTFTPEELEELKEILHIEK